MLRTTPKLLEDQCLVNKPVTIGILDCDVIADELIDDYVSYPLMFQQLFDRLEACDVAVQYQTFHVCGGSLPSATGVCDAYLITGSKTGVYDDEPWLLALRTFLQNAYGAGIPLVGICFGHQMLANSLGGKAEKSDKGWGIGAMTHSQKNTFIDIEQMPADLTLLFSHQDQVTALPRHAQVLYGSAFCNVGAYRIGKQVLSFQGHPEFTHEYSRRLMTLRQARYPTNIFEEGLMTLDQATDELWVAQLMRQFLLGLLP